MTDIVERLEGWHEEIERRGSAALGLHKTDNLLEVISEAAQEIKRLRELATALLELAALNPKPFPSGYRLS